MIDRRRSVKSVRVPARLCMTRDFGKNGRMAVRPCASDIDERFAGNRLEHCGRCRSRQSRARTGRDWRNCAASTGGQSTRISVGSVTPDTRRKT